MNNPYLTIVLRALDLIENTVLYLRKFSKHKKRLGGLFKNRTSKNVERIAAFETTPRGKFGCNYSPVKFIFKDELEQDYFNDIKDLPVYLQDYTDVDFSHGYFVVRKKSAAARLMEGHVTKKYRDTHLVNDFIQTGDLFDDLFYVKQMTKQEYQDEKKYHPERILKPLFD